MEGLEPPRIAPVDFESTAYTGSATSPLKVKKQLKICGY